MAVAETPDYPHYGPIYISADSGGTWISNTVSPKSWVGVASSADGTKLAAVDSVGDVYTSTNSGTFSFQSSIPERLSCVASSADGTKLVAAGLNGSIYISTNSGGTWSPSSGTSGKIWESVASSADGTKLVAAALNDSVYTSTDSGNTWISNNLPHLTWVSVASSADGNILAAAPGGFNLGNGPIYVSTNSGGNWTSNNSPILAWGSVASSVDGTKLIAAAYANRFSNSIFTSTDFGVTWVSNNVPAENWSSVAASADGNILIAVTGYGGIWTSQNTPLPHLNISSMNGNLAFSWIIPSTNFVLQQNLDLTTTNWLTLTNTPTLNLANLQDQVMLSPFNGTGFYRLATP